MSALDNMAIARPGTSNLEFADSRVDTLINTGASTNLTISSDRLNTVKNFSTVNTVSNTTLNNNALNALNTTKELSSIYDISTMGVKSYSSNMIVQSYSDLDRRETLYSTLSQLKNLQITQQTGLFDFTEVNRPLVMAELKQIYQDINGNIYEAEDIFKTYDGICFGIKIDKYKKDGNLDETITKTSGCTIFNLNQVLEPTTYYVYAFNDQINNEISYHQYFGEIETVEDNVFGTKVPYYDNLVKTDKIDLDDIQILSYETACKDNNGRVIVLHTIDMPYIEYNDTYVYGLDKLNSNDIDLFRTLLNVKVTIEDDNGKIIEIKNVPFSSSFSYSLFRDSLKNLISNYSLYSESQLTGYKNTVGDNGLINKKTYTYVNNHQLFVPVNIYTDVNDNSYNYEPYNVSEPDDTDNFIEVSIREGSKNDTSKIITFTTSNFENENDSAIVYYYCDEHESYFYVKEGNDKKQLLPLNINGINYYSIIETDNYSIYFNISSIVQDDRYNFIELSNISFGNINLENNLVNVLTITPSEYFHSKITLNKAIGKEDSSDNTTYIYYNGKNLLFNDENIVINEIKEDLYYIDEDEKTSMTYIQYLTSMSSTYGFEYVEGLSTISGYMFDPNVSSIKYKRDILYPRSGLNTSYEYYSPKDQTYIKYENQILKYRNNIYGSDIFDNITDNCEIELVDVFLRTITETNVNEIVKNGGIKKPIKNDKQEIIDYDTIPLLSENNNDIIATYSTVPFILANDYDYEFSHYEYNEPITSYIMSYSSNGENSSETKNPGEQWTYVTISNGISFNDNESSILKIDGTNKSISLNAEYVSVAYNVNEKQTSKINDNYTFIDIIPYESATSNNISSFVNTVLKDSTSSDKDVQSIINDVFNTESSKSSNKGTLSYIITYISTEAKTSKIYFENDDIYTLNGTFDWNNINSLFNVKKTINVVTSYYDNTKTYNIDYFTYNFILRRTPFFIETTNKSDIKIFKITPDISENIKNGKHINSTVQQELVDAYTWIWNNRKIDIFTTEKTTYHNTIIKSEDVSGVCLIYGVNYTNAFPIKNYETLEKTYYIGTSTRKCSISLTYITNQPSMNFTPIINLDGYWERKYNQKIKPLVNISYTYSSNSIDISNAYIVPTTKNERMGFIHNYKISYNYIDYEMNEEYVYTYFDEHNMQKKWEQKENSNVINLGNNEYMGVEINEIKTPLLEQTSSTQEMLYTSSQPILTYSTSKYGDEISFNILQNANYADYYLYQRICYCDTDGKVYETNSNEIIPKNKTQTNVSKNQIINIFDDYIKSVLDKYNSLYSSKENNYNPLYTKIIDYITKDQYIYDILRLDKDAKTPDNSDKTNKTNCLNDTQFNNISINIEKLIKNEIPSINITYNFGKIFRFSFNVRKTSDANFDVTCSFYVVYSFTLATLDSYLGDNNTLLIDKEFNKNYKTNYHKKIKLNSDSITQLNNYKTLYRRLNVKSEQVLKEYIVQEEELVPQIAQIDTPFGLVNGKKVVVTDQVYVPETYVTVTTIDPETKEYVTERVLANDAYMAYTYEVEDIPFITSTYVFNGDEGIKIQGLDLLIEHFTGQKINNSSDNSSLPSSNSTTSLSNGYNGAVISKAFQKSFDSYLSYISNSFVYLNEALDRNTKNISQAISDNNNREYLEQLKVLTNALYSTANSQASVDVLNTSNTINAQKNMINKISDSINNQTSTLSRMMLISMLGNSTSGYTYGAQTLFNNVLSSMTAAMPKNWQSVTKIGYQTTEIVEVNTYKSTSSKHTKVIGKEQRASNFKEVTTNHIYQYPSYVSFSYMNAFEDNSSTTERIGLHLTKESRDFTYNGYVYHEDYFTYKNVADILADLHVSQALPTRAEFIVDLSKRLYINSDFIFSYTSPSEYAKRAIYRADVLWTELVNANIVKSEESSYRPLPSIPAERNYWYYDNVKFSYFAYAFNLDMIKLQQADESVFRAIDSIIGSRIDNDVNEDDVTTISNILLNSSKMDVLSNIWGTNKDSLTEEVLTKLNKIIKPYLASYNSYEMHITDKVVMTKPDMIIKREKDLPDKKEVIKRNTKV